MPESGEKKSVSLTNEWKAAWSDAAFRIQTVITLVLLTSTLVLFSHFLEWIEGRPGIVLNDPVLKAVPPHDFTWPIFMLIYGSLVVGLMTLSLRPRRLMLAFQSYIIMMGVRVVAMYLTPLDPPNGIIPLADPFVQFFGQGTVPTKDLFFSGHTSTLLILAFTATRNRLGALFVLSAILVAVLVVWQHVHYSVDVLVAPFVAYGSYRVARLVNKRNDSNTSTG
jgi:hypothetical protein